MLGVAGHEVASERPLVAGKRPTVHGRVPTQAVWKLANRLLARRGAGFLPILAFSVEPLPIKGRISRYAACCSPIGPIEA